MYFYVPKGTRVVAGETLSAAGVLRDGAGEVALEFSTLGDVSARQKSGTPYFIVSVQDKQDGSLWKIEGLTPGTYCMLYTVPPYYARSAEELLLPKEVVERDAAN
jgi:hypothetical protein